VKPLGPPPRRTPVPPEPVPVPVPDSANLAGPMSMRHPPAPGARKPVLSILAATSNRGKLAELRQLLADLPVEVLSWSTVLRGRPQAVEDGATFEDNALIKARAAASAAIMVTLADDSGLEVDALDGRPGVRSARFAKEGATDAENNAALLGALSDIEDDRRTARFRCVLVLVDPWASVHDKGAQPTITEGRCEGVIARHVSGAGGFGYDPLFVVDGTGRTMAELGAAEKNRLSHRARAVEAMRPAIAALVAERLAHAARVLG
jgi:XTP/dITP diphosphohydrolase